METYDAIVVGAGNGGLTASATLAKSGLKVLLLERHNIPGGSATSFCRGRFEFEVALHQLSGIGTLEKPGPLRMVLDEIGIMDKVDFLPMGDLFRVVVPGAVDITLKPEREQIVETLKQHFPHESEGIDRFFDLVWKTFSEVIGVFYFKDPEVTREKYPHFFKHSLKTLSEIFDTCFADPVLRTVVSPYWTYMGLPPSRLSFIDMAAMLFAYTEFLPFHIRGGSQALSNALADVVMTNGGDIRFNCGAREIIVEKGRARGVVTENGEEIRSRFVVSNASKITTYIDMVEESERPAKILDELKQSSLGQSAFTLYLGMDCPPEDLGLTASTNFIIGDTDTDRIHQGMRHRDIGEKDGMLLTCYDLIEDSFSPEGCCQIALVTLKYGDCWLSVPPEEYAKEKFRLADGMLSTAEKVHPGIRGHIEEMEIATPLTHLRYLGHPKGSIYGFESYLKSSSFFIPNRSNIKGLYNTGGWYGSCGFQPTLESGIKAAKALVREFTAVKEASS